MNDFVRMDIFFVVATFGIVVLSIFVSIFLFYAIRVARTLDRLAVDIAEEAHALKGDLDDARMIAKREGKQLLHIVDSARKAAEAFVRPRRKRSK